MFTEIHLPLVWSKAKKCGSAIFTLTFVYYTLLLFIPPDIWLSSGYKKKSWIRLCHTSWINKFIYRLTQTNGEFVSVSSARNDLADVSVTHNLCARNDTMFQFGRLPPWISGWSLPSPGVSEKQSVQIGELLDLPVRRHSQPSRHKTCLLESLPRWCHRRGSLSLSLFLPFTCTHYLTRSALSSK